ncbi:hypothetical protein DY000_02032484 [Brassica cretica]|uniref:NAC domain-containing protein n=1 Tax=Brassica cretica TaxID=69181 RepID=A0ABQ7DVU8_BRACR|nr:hypothetical protein DY000_02032484 [Brassica cretica]
MMSSHFYLSPNFKGCMVDLYGRAGQLDKALEIIHVSSCHEDPVLWRTLLGSCKIIHRNLELEEVAIYEETDAAQGFQCRGLLPGWSWIEIDDQVHKFVTTLREDDSSEKQAQRNATTLSTTPNMQSSSSLAYPPGYRFVPTDAEIIYYYLKPFSPDNKKSWPNLPIHHMNIYESNPQQLTAEYKKGNLTEWFFISERTKIKRNGQKQKRVDHNGGYLHSKAVTKKIKVKKDVVGYKTTLNYFIGKQPNGERTNWLMQEYWLESSGHNNTVDYALCKIYLSPTAQKNMKEEDVEELEEEAVQPRTVEIQQPQPPQFYPTPLVSHQPQPQFWPTELDSHQPQRQDNEYQEPLQAQPLNTIYKLQSQRHNTESEYQEPHQPQPLDTIDHHQPQLHDSAYQEPPQPQPLDTIHYHRSQLHDIEYQEPHQSQPLDNIIHHQSHQVQFWQATSGSHQRQLHDITYNELQPPDTVQDQLPQFWAAPLDSYPQHCHDIQYPQPQPLDTIEYQYLYQSGPLTTCENVIESCTQDKSNGDIKKVDHALKIHLTPRGIKREVEEEEDEKRKRKKKGGVEAPKEELEQLINSHQNSDNDDSFFTGFVDSHLLYIDIESSVGNCCLKKSSDEN